MRSFAEDLRAERLRRLVEVLKAAMIRDPRTDDEFMPTGVWLR